MKSMNQLSSTPSATGRSTRPLTGYVPLGFLGSEHQTLLAIQPVDPLLLHCPSFPLQEAVESAGSHSVHGPEPGP